MNLVFATNNKGKLKEMRALTSDLDIQVLSAAEAGANEEVTEDGNTFWENAHKKASWVTQKTGEYAVADDSGLCIDYLDGAPGVKSARWAGEEATEGEMIGLALEKLKGTPKEQRSAQFRTVLVLVSPEGKYWDFSGEIQGEITQQPLGDNREALPYDLIFRPDGFEETFAQMSDEHKNSLSHRGKAFQKLREFLLSIQDDKINNAISL